MSNLAKEGIYEQKFIKITGHHSLYAYVKKTLLKIFSWELLNLFLYFQSASYSIFWYYKNVINFLKHADIINNLTDNNKCLKCYNFFKYNNIILNIPQKSTCAKNSSVIMKKTSF